MTSSLSFTRFFRSLNGFTLGQHTKYRRGPALAAIAAVIIVPIAIRDYLIFLSYGPGGLPYNPIGWLMTNLMRLLSREQLSTRPYSDEKSPSNNDYGLLPTDLPHRDSPRPRLGPHPVPQRQLSQLPEVEMRQRLITRFNALGETAQKRGLVEIKQSLYERHHSAFFVSKSLDWHVTAQQTRGEVSHVHAGKDGSIHVVLHSKDCKVVLEKGWGQRHALSGVDFMKRVAGFSLPVNYILIYAPRNEAEIEIAMVIVKASIQFMTGSREQLE
jgi:hypothetical protein